MIYVGNNDLTAYLAFQICKDESCTVESVPERAYFKNYTDMLIKKADRIYIIDITSFSDDEETMVTEIDRLCRACNADIIIDAPLIDEDSKILTSLRALGYIKIITERENQSKIKNELQKYMLMPKVSSTDINESIVNNRESIYEAMIMKNPALAKIESDKEREEDVKQGNMDFIEELDFISPSSLGNTKDFKENKEKQEIPEKISDSLENILSSDPEVEVEEPKVRNISIKSFSANITNVVKIAVVGVMPRIGATTISIQMVKFLNDIEEKSAAYLQRNNSSFIEDIKDYYNIEDNKKESKVSFQNIDIFYNPSKVQDIIMQGYRYIVYDYGNLSSISRSEKNSIFEKDIILLIGGCEPEEIAKTTEALHDFNQKNVFYLFNFVPQKDEMEILDQMEDSSSKTFFIPYCPDRYVFNTDFRCIFTEIIISDYQTEQGPSGKKKRTGRMFRK